MNYPNFITILSTLILAVIFFGGVFLNLDIKNHKEEIKIIKEDIKKIEMDIKRKEIEIAQLTNPHLVYEYIKENEMVPVNMDNIYKIEIVK